MELTKERYDILIADKRTLGMYKVKIKEYKDEVERLNRIINLRDKEIDDLNLLLSKKVEFINKMKGIKCEKVAKR